MFQKICSFLFIVLLTGDGRAFSVLPRTTTPTGRRSLLGKSYRGGFIGRFPFVKQRIRYTNPQLVKVRAIPIRSGSFFEKGEELIPEENPELAVSNQNSTSGVSYQHVLEGLKTLYPPQALEQRNAASRTDGYWPFINSGQEPPKQYTYGEFDFYFFAQLLDRALEYFNEGKEKASTWDGKVFCDIGSGTGRLVLAAAALHPGWKVCRGVEILKNIHNVAVETLEKCRQEEKEVDRREYKVEGETKMPLLLRSATSNSDGMEWFGKLRSDLGVDDEGEEVENTVDDTDYKTIESSNDSQHEDMKADDFVQVQNNDTKSEKLHPFHFLPGDDSLPLPLAPIEFSCGSFEDPYEYIGDANCVFCFSSCMSESVMSSLAESLGRQCQPGTIVITTEFMLPLQGTCDAIEDDDKIPHGPFEFDLLEKVDGWSWLLGGQSTAYIHRVKSSLWQEGVGRRMKPEIPLEVQALRVVRALEDGTLTDTENFLREVRNNCLFYGFPESWWPALN